MSSVIDDSGVRIDTVLAAVYNAFAASAV